MMIRCLGGFSLLIPSGFWFSIASTSILENNMNLFLTTNFVFSLVAFIFSLVFLCPTGGQLPKDPIDNWLRKRVKIAEETKLEITEVILKSLDEPALQ